MVEWGGGSKSVITATHDLGHLEDIADRCYVLDGGKLVAEGRPADILVNTGLLRRTNLIHAHRHGLFRGQAT
jgi:cobalt/nickel transport system ATP-binding protein